MELMSSLLFCALVAHFPQAFGESSPDTDIKFNNSMLFHQMPMPKKILLNLNGPPLVNMVSELQTVFMDVACSQCIDCMERAIKAYTTHYHIIKTMPSTDELHEQILRLARGYRNKRDSSTTPTKITTKTRKSKSRNRPSRSVTVTKYNANGYVFALKVKETNLIASADQQNDTVVSSCQVFSVKKSFPCESPEGESLLSSAKRKVIKKNKKDINKAGATTSAKPHFMAPAFKKRQIDNSQIPDNFMPSIEDLY